MMTPMTALLINAGRTLSIPGFWPKPGEIYHTVIHALFKKNLLFFVFLFGGIVFVVFLVFLKT